ncbi:hypothetical protein AAG906_006662 [Vitis piasezkii]
MVMITSPLHRDVLTRTLISQETRRKFPQFLRTNFFYASSDLGEAREEQLHNMAISVNSSQPASNPEYDQWVILDQFLLSWILASISEAMYGHVVNCQTSAEVWSVLEKLFVSDSKARTLQLRFMLQSLKKGALSINDYVLKMRNIADMLSASGKPVPDEDLILYILGGLGPEFETIVVNITSRSEAISLQEVHYLLQSHEIRLEQLSATSVIDVPPAAHITVGGVQNSNTNDGQFRGSSNKNFHLRNVRNPQTSRIVYQLCGKMEHTTVKCFHRFDVYFQSPPRAQNQQPPVPSRPIQNSHQQLDSTNTSPHAYIVAPDLDSNTSWFVDSGATHHMTTDSNTLDVSDHYSGTGNVVVGNGQTLDISSVGHTSFPSRKSSKSLHLANVLHVPQITKNLISVAKFTQDNDVILEFDSHCCFVKDKKSREILLQGNLKEGLYQLDISKVSSNRQFVGFSEDTNVFLPHLATTPSTINKQSIAPSVRYSLQVNKIESTRCVEDNNTGVGYLWHQRLVSPSIPSPPISAHSLHPMTTRSKVGTFKPKLLLTTSHTCLLRFTLAPTFYHVTMVEEYQALVRNNTWTLVPFHPSMNVIDSKWIFRVKYNSDGTIQRYKARLVAKGFQQYAGVKFTDTFSPMIKASTIRVVFTLVVTYNWEIRQIDFNNAFLNGEIAETVYLSQPIGFVSTSHPNMFDLQNRFALKDLGLVKDFLGFEALRTTTGLHLTQSKYTTDLLIKTKMHSAKPVPTPMSATLKLHAASGPAFSDPTLYKSTIAFVNKLDQYLQNLELHWTTCKRVLRYLKGIVHRGLHFTPASSLHLQVYTDADWASSIDDRRSTTGYCVFLGTNLLTWSSRKQSVVARSSTEAEYRALAHASTEVAWLRSLFSELGISLVNTPVIWCDNQGVGALAANPPLSIPRFQYLLTKLNLAVSPGCA